MEKAKPSNESALTSYHSLLTSEILSAVLGISQRTLRRWVRHGHFLPPMHIGPYGAPRWHPQDVITYLRASDGQVKQSRAQRNKAGRDVSPKETSSGTLREIPGTVSQGVVVPDAPLPEGVRVEIRVMNGL